jgi:hypothetical protein
MLDCWRERKLGQETSRVVSFLSEKKKSKTICLARTSLVLFSERIFPHKSLTMCLVPYFLFSPSQSTSRLHGVYFNFKKNTLCPDFWAYHSQLDFFVKKLRPSDLDQVEMLPPVLRPQLFYFASKYPRLKEVIYMEFFGHTHNYMSTCSTGRGSFHIVEEFVEFNSENDFLCRYLERTRNEFTNFKKTFEQDRPRS